MVHQHILAPGSPAVSPAAGMAGIQAQSLSWHSDRMTGVVTGGGALHELVIHWEVHHNAGRFTIILVGSSYSLVYPNW